VSAQGGWSVELPASLAASRNGETAILTLSRPAKRNALSGEIILGIENFFRELPDDIKVVVINGDGDNFSAGLDLSELRDMDVSQALTHSRLWHRVFEGIEFGRVPAICVLHGAVLGGGLELAAACHLRVADDTAYYGLPEAQRGIFVGGGGSVRLPRLIGTALMADMMLTGRVLDAHEGQGAGISQYLVAAGTGLAKGLALAEKVASNAPLTNFAVIQALPRIVDADPATGLLLEALMAAAAQSDEEAKLRLRAFLEKRASKVLRG
jgi:enoyl-CoA hydratase/carnithine racemase